MLKHPLFLIFVSVILGFLAGWITNSRNRRLDLHQKSLDSDKELAVEVLGSDENLTTAMQFLRNAPREGHKHAGMDKTVELQRKLDDAYSDWKSKSAKIEAKIRSRDSNQSLLEKWTDFKDAVDDLYAMLGIDDSGIQTYADSLSGKLKELFEKNGVKRHDRNWATSKNVIKTEKLQIATDILESPDLKIPAKKQSSD